MDDTKLSIWKKLERKYPYRTTRELWDEAQESSDIVKAISTGIGTVLSAVRAEEMRKRVAAVKEWAANYSQGYLERRRREALLGYHPHRRRGVKSVRH